jgi:hypothetical protein
MTDALSEVVRVGLRNPVRVVVKVQSKKLAGAKRKAEEIEERRTPATYVLLTFRRIVPSHSNETVADSRIIFCNARPPRKFYK